MVIIYHIWCPSITLCVDNCHLFSFQHYVTIFVFYQKQNVWAFNIILGVTIKAVRKLAVNKWICLEKMWLFSCWFSLSHRFNYYSATWKILSLPCTEQLQKWCRSIKGVFTTLSNICDTLRDFVPFVQLKKLEKRPWRSDAFSKVAGIKSATLLKVTLLYGCFSRFLNCANVSNRGKDLIHDFIKDRF